MVISLLTIVLFVTNQLLIDERIGRPPRSLESVDDRLARRVCEKYNRRLEKAKKIMEKAEEEIMNMDFAIFLKKTHPVSSFP